VIDRKREVLRNGAFAGAGAGGDIVLGVGGKVVLGGAIATVLGFGGRGVS